jgi:hypothetical protein
VEITVTGPPGPRDAVSPENLAAARADVNPQAKRQLKHKIKAKQAEAKGTKKQK